MRGGPRVLGIVLAGGEGKRLVPLTAGPGQARGALRRQLPARRLRAVQPGQRRLSGRSCVLTQYKSHSLDRHITTTWRMSTLLGNYVTPVPAQQRLGPRWYTGSADAIFQSLNLIYDERPEIVVVFGADHVYRMDPAQMVDQHIATGAGVTVAGHPGAAQGGRPSSASSTPTTSGKVARSSWRSRPTRPACRAAPDETFASMGNYVFTTDALLEALRVDAADEDSVHDMGGSIMPMMAEQGDAVRLRLQQQRRARRDRARPRLLARRGDPGRLLRRAHGPGLGPPGLQPLQRPLADLHPAAACCRRRSSCSAAGPRSRWSAPA